VRKVSTSHHQSSFINSFGFTLIELLVVISIIVLLAAVLMPMLSRARAQARTVVCRSNLGQWALLWGMYVEDNDGRLPSHMDLQGQVSFAWVLAGPWGVNAIPAEFLGQARMAATVQGLLIPIMRESFVVYHHSPV
jgi:prepilin-type N-terminal cleavage/methylation domain-containing protein